MDRGPSDNAIRPRWRGWVWALVFAVALAIRLVYVHQVESLIYFYQLVGDAAGYDAWARQLVENGWHWPDTFYQAPLYPYFLSLIYSLGGHDLWLVRVVQCVMGASGCVMLALSTANFLSRRAGIVAGVMMTVYPPAIYFDGIIQKASLSFVLMAALLWALSIDIQRSRRWTWGVVGVLLGLLALTRENALALLPIVVVWLLLRARRGNETKHRGFAAALVVLGWAVTLLPAVTHNYRAGGGFALTTFQMGPNFYMGNHANADGRYQPMIPGRETPEFERADATNLAKQATGRNLTPTEVSEFWLDQALVWIRSNPLDWARLMWTKWGLTWNRYEIPDTESYQVCRDTSWILGMFGYAWHFGTLCPLAVGGVYLTWSRRRDLGVLFTVAPVLAAAVAAFYVSGRYRYPLVPAPVVLAACCVTEFVVTVKKRRWDRTLQAAGLMLVSAIWVNWPINPESKLNAAQLGNLGATLAANGRLDDALPRFKQAVAIYPEAPRLQQFLADALSFAGRYEESVPHYRAALRQEPGRANADFNLAVALERLGRVDEAKGHYKRAFEANPQDSTAKEALQRLSGE